MRKIITIFAFLLPAIFYNGAEAQSTISSGDWSLNTPGVRVNTNMWQVDLIPRCDPRGRFYIIIYVRKHEYGDQIEITFKADSIKKIAVEERIAHELEIDYVNSGLFRDQIVRTPIEVSLPGVGPFMIISRNAAESMERLQC